MTVLDTILQLLAASGGHATLLRAAQVPLMLTGNTQSALPLAPLTPEQMAEIVAHIVPATVQARLRESGSVDYTIPAGDGRPPLVITAIGSADDIWLEVRPQSAPVHAPATEPPPASRNHGAVTAIAAGRAAGAAEPPPPSRDQSRPAAPAAAHGRRRVATSRDVHDLIAQVAGPGETALFLHNGRPPAVKIDGAVHWLDDYEAIGADDIGRLLIELSDDLQRLGGLERDEMLSWTVPDLAEVECRANLAPPAIQLTFRIASARPASAARLRIPDSVATMCLEQYGLLVVAGPRPPALGRTCHALVDLVNRERPHHIIVLERPSALRHAKGPAFLSHRSVTGDDEAWKGALAAALAEAPDVLMTEHVPSAQALDLLMAHAAQTLIIAQVVAPSSIAALQQLLRLAGDGEAEAASRMADALAAVMAQQEVKLRGAGTATLYEVVPGTPAVRDLLRQRAFDQLGLLLEGGAEGVISMSAALAEFDRTQRSGSRRGTNSPLATRTTAPGGATHAMVAAS